MKTRKLSIPTGLLFWEFPPPACEVLMLWCNMTCNMMITSIEGYARMTEIETFFFPTKKRKCVQTWWSHIGWPTMNVASDAWPNTCQTVHFQSFVVNGDSQILVRSLNFDDFPLDSSWLILTPDRRKGWCPNCSCPRPWSCSSHCTGRKANILESNAATHFESRSSKMQNEKSKIMPALTPNKCKRVQCCETGSWHKSNSNIFCVKRENKWETSVKSCDPEHPEWETSVKSCGPEHPEWNASPETKAKSCGPGMQPFERSKDPTQVNLFGTMFSNPVSGKNWLRLSAKEPAGSLIKVQLGPKEQAKVTVPA